MRTVVFLASGLLLMASLLIIANLFFEHVPLAPDWVPEASTWIGVSKAGYSVAEELPPVAAAVLVRWRFL